MERPGVQRGDWGWIGLALFAVGAFLIAVSIGLFMHTISQLASPIVCAAFIAAGIVGRQRATTAAGSWFAVGSIVGGAVAAVAGIVLTATGH